MHNGMDIDGPLNAFRKTYPMSYIVLYNIMYLHYLAKYEEFRNWDASLVSFIH